MNVKTLKKQALKRWGILTHLEQDELHKALQERPPGTAVIELDPIVTIHNSNYCLVSSTQGRIVDLFLGMDIQSKSDKRYLMLSDIPVSAESEA